LTVNTSPGSELQVPPVGDHRALPGEHLAVDGVLDGLGVLDGHPGRVGRLHHVLVGEKITLHTGMLSRSARFRQATRGAGELGSPDNAVITMVEADA
jgi:hypothetical protein